MSKTDLSRRKFLGKSGAAALALPLAAAIPAVIEGTSPKAVEAAMENDEQQTIPNRAITARTIGTANQTVSLPASGSDCSSAIQSAINAASSGGGGVVTIPYKNDGVCYVDIMANSYVAPNGNTAYYAVTLANNVGSSLIQELSSRPCPITTVILLMSSGPTFSCARLSIMSNSVI